jgi:ubiquinone/menaquinone biosynthesis C-methylase UbiE
MLQLWCALFIATTAQALAAWTTAEKREEAGSKIDVFNNGQPVATFIFGPRELKPFLHVFASTGELLTAWDPKQHSPHHRGIFIGWNKIESDIGNSDLWHLNHGEKMLVKEVRHTATATNATIVATINWHAQKPDANGDSILLVETRRLDISQPAPGKTQIDAQFTLDAMRDITLNGDLQHAGVHFRGSNELDRRTNETRYVWEPDLPGPDGRVVSTDLKWCRLIFPIGTNWFAATELNSPGNPTAELSWRDYGRFGFFFKHKLEWGDTLDVKYRFITEPVSPSAKDDLPGQRAIAARYYDDYGRPPYETRARHDPDGIGKFYMGREIAHVMGHQGADWLERPEREQEEKPSQLVELLDLKRGAAVADIGAGTGYISWRMAQKVGPNGRIYAVDIQQEMLDLLAEKMKARGVQNVTPVLGTITNANLPANSIDLAIMVDVYHEFSHPYEMMKSIHTALKPGGRLAFVEYRAEDLNVPIKPVHKMTEMQVKKEAVAAGFEWEKTIADLPRQHVIIVRKR